jgi:hypothetical protein
VDALRTEDLSIVYEHVPRRGRYHIRPTDDEVSRRLNEDGPDFFEPFTLSEAFFEKENTCTRQWIDRMLSTLFKDYHPRHRSWIWLREWMNNHSRFPHKMALYLVYASYESRLNSYKHFPKNVSVTCEKLAEAGFYYMGYMDSVRCFACGGVVSGWQAQDAEPWKIHCYYYPNCLYCAYERGGDFIKNAHFEKRLEGFSEMVEAAKNGGEWALDKDLTICKNCIAKEKEKKDEKIELTKAVGLIENSEENKCVCVVCLTNKVNVLILPCAHAIGCNACILSLTACPSCRIPIQGCVKIYLP